uniref:Uncharacterized protein n=1 Tax=Cladonia uncialis subsp. uncialis TaxID=180999 RepID=A0A2K9YDX7_CLAUC|nr:hypothetical protein [Cladonia uncialis subsp. uncialis]
MPIAVAYCYHLSRSSIAVTYHRHPSLLPTNPRYGPLVTAMGDGDGRRRWAAAMGGGENTRRQRKGRTDSAISVKPPQSPAIETDEGISIKSDEEVETGEVQNVNADGYIEEDLEAQYIKLFSRATFLTNLLGFRRSADAQLCEQLEDGMWERAAKFFRIPGYGTSTSKDVHKIPGMLKPLYHWQWLCVFVSILFNAGTNDRFGALIGDEMGLRKTWEALAFAVFHQQLWQQCNFRTWLAELRDLVDFNMLGIKLVVAHASVTDTDLQLTAQIKLNIRTARDQNDPEAQLPKKGPTTKPEQRGLPSAESRLVWILTTWNTWQVISKNNDSEKYELKYQKDKQTMIDSTEVRSFHCGLAIVDECHTVKNVGKGPWGTLRDMKTDRPGSRFWFAALSETILKTNPSDIAGPMDIIDSKTCDNHEHPYYPFSGDELKRLGRAVEQSVEEEGDSAVQDSAQQYIKTFGHTLPNFLIRRHEMSRWNRDPLIELEPLHQLKRKAIFPAKFDAAYNGSMPKWAQESTRRLAEKQALWQENCWKSATYAAQHPNKPMTLDATQVLNTARTLCLTSDLSFLCTIAHESGQKWDNVTIQTDCQDRDTGRMKPGCILNQHYASII